MSARSFDLSSNQDGIPRAWRPSTSGAHGADLQAEFSIDDGIAKRTITRHFVDRGCGGRSSRRSSSNGTYKLAPAQVGSAKLSLHTQNESTRCCRSRSLGTSNLGPVLYRLHNEDDDNYLDRVDFLYFLESNLANTFTCSGTMPTSTPPAMPAMYSAPKQAPAATSGGSGGNLVS